MLRESRRRGVWAILFLLGWAAASESGTAPKTASIRAVIDGDTVELADGRRVRYIGIDTPELRRRQGDRWVLRPEPWAEEALEMNRRLVEGKTVRLELDREREDGYRRLLAYVYVGDLFVNGELVRYGLASVRLYPPNLKQAETLLKAQREAQKAHRGIWGGSPS
jgi:micrococcal nuclease